MLEAFDSYLSTIPEVALIVMATSLGWVIGTAILYLIIELFGGL